MVLSRDEGDGGTYMTHAFFILVSSIRALGVTQTNITFYLQSVIVDGLIPHCSSRTPPH
jgi:hypothetical protein